MSNPTTPFGWQMPTATDLVTDLPADFEVFGQAVATSMGDLLGGTSGQILAKNSNTDMDFVWIANDQGDITGITATSPLTGGGSSGAITVGIQDALTTQKGAVQLSDSTSTTSSILAATPTAVKSAFDLATAAIPKSTVTTNGDLIYGTGSATVARIGIGSTSQVLTVSGGIPAWQTPSAAASGLTLVTRSSFSNVASVTYDSVFSGTYTAYMVVFENYFAATAADDMLMELRYGSTTETGTTYRYVSTQTASSSSTVTGLNSGSNAVNFMLADQSGNSTEPTKGHLIIPFAGHAGTFGMNGQFSNIEASRYFNFNGTQYTSRTYTGFVLKSAASNISGTVTIYGLAE